MSARVVASSTSRSATRVAIHTRWSSAAAPSYTASSGGVPCTSARRPLDGPDDVGDRHLGGRTRQPVAAVGAALAADDPGAPELGEDALEEPDRDPLGRGDGLALHRGAGAVVGGMGGQLGRGPHRVVDLGGDPHARGSGGADGGEARHRGGAPVLPQHVEVASVGEVAEREPGGRIGPGDLARGPLWPKAARRHRAAHAAQVRAAVVAGDDRARGCGWRGGPASGRGTCCAPRS